MLRTIVGFHVALGLTGCNLPESASYRFRMTVEVDTSAGLMRGSSVMEERASRSIVETSERGPGSGGTYGDCVVVDLPDGHLFILRQTPGARGGLGGFVTQALDHSAHFGGFEPYFAAVKRLGGWFVHAKAELPSEDWPMMVRFRDIDDPATVEQVDPATVGVKRILLETTGDAMSAGIENKMPPWFARLVRERARLNGSTSIAVSTSDLADNLGPSSFSTELRK